MFDSIVITYEFWGVGSNNKYITKQSVARVHLNAFCLHNNIEVTTCLRVVEVYL
jgi:hypothetical protein